MRVQVYDKVALTRDLPEHRLRRGDIATLLDYVTHPGGGEDGCVLEVFNAIGESIAVIAVPKSAIGPLQAGEIMTVRPLAAAS